MECCRAAGNWQRQKYGIEDAALYLFVVISNGICYAAFLRTLMNFSSMTSSQIYPFSRLLWLATAEQQAADIHVSANVGTMCIIALEKQTIDETRVFMYMCGDLLMGAILLPRSAEWQARATPWMGEGENASSSRFQGGRRLAMDAKLDTVVTSTGRRHGCELNGGITRLRIGTGTEAGGRRALIVKLFIDSGKH